MGSPRDREVACTASDRQGSNFESCVWRTVSSQSSHHPQEVLLAQFSLYVHKGGLKPDSFHLVHSDCGWLLNTSCKSPIKQTLTRSWIINNVTCKVTDVGQTLPQLWVNVGPTHRGLIRHLNITINVSVRGLENHI